MFPRRRSLLWQTRSAWPNCPQKPKARLGKKLSRKKATNGGSRTSWPRNQSRLPCLPEGIEFTPDGTQLFAQLTYAHRIAVFDVDGFMLKRSPFVIRVGHGPSSMAIGPRFSK